MALTRAIAATGETSTNTELTVTANIAGNNKVSLPAIDNGGGATVAAQFVVSVYNQHASATLEVVDALGFRVAYMGPQSALSLKATGDVTKSQWQVVPLVEAVQLKATDVVAVGAGATLAFTANTNALILTPGTVNAYIKVRLVDGTIGYIPVWK